MKSLKYLAIAFLSCLSLGMLTFAGLTIHYARNLPTLDALKNYQPRLVTRVYDKDGEIMAEFSTEKRITVSFEELGDTVVNAFISAEDDEFFHHRGVNPITIFRAAVKNAIAGHTVQGGSTITQQVAKSILLSPEKSMERKIREMILAFRMERALTKEEIIGIYLNQIFLGNGAYGVEAAAQIYFGKHAKELSVAEAAVLAGLPRAPTRDNPLVNPKGALQRQHYVLGRMRDTHRITPAAYDEARASSLQLKTRRDFPTPTPYATEYVRRYLLKKYGTDAVYNDGLKVYTTFKVGAVKAAQDALNTGIRALDKRIGLRKPMKTLRTPKERDTYLAKTHDKLIEEFFDYKVLTPDGELHAPSKDGEPTPLELSKNYQAVVIGKDKKTRQILVQVGTRKGHIKPEDWVWATTADPDEVYPEKVIRSPMNELQIGDVITVQARVLDPGKDEFMLEQEPLVQGSLLSYSVPEGELVAMVGGYDFNVTKSEFNRAIQAVRQPGSTFKPIVYACALDSGLTPSTIIVDSPIVYKDADEKSQVEKVWRPNNFGEKFYGDTRLREALTYSRNIPTIKLLQYLKVQHVIEYANKLGVKSPLAPDLSLGLGSSGVTLEELLGAYGTFANGGNKLPVHFITRVEDRNGTALEENKVKDVERVIPDSTAFLVTSILKSVVEVGTGQAVKPLGRPIAGKTGTTNDFKDALFVGFVPQMLTGVWVGFDEDRPLGRNETGGRSAAPIWLEYMKYATEKVPVKDFDPPASVSQVAIDEETGDVPTPRTRKKLTEFFANGTAPGTPFVENANPTTPPADRSRLASAADGNVLNKTKVITGNPDLPVTEGGTPSESSSPEGSGSDDLYRNDL